MGHDQAVGKMAASQGTVLRSSEGCRCISTAVVLHTCKDLFKGGMYPNVSFLFVF